MQFDVNFQQRNYAFAQSEDVLNIDVTVLNIKYGDINVSIAYRQNVLVSKFISHFKINVFIACSIIFQYLIFSGIFFFNLFQHFSWMPTCYLACLIKYIVCLRYHIEFNEGESNYSYLV